jgi:hypothetical protein
VLIDDMMRPLCTDWNVYARLRDTAGGSDSVQVARRGLNAADGGMGSHSHDRLSREARQGPGRGPRSSTISWTALLAR